MSGYTDFAAYYDRLTQDVGYACRAEYLRTLLAQQGVTGGILLDLACGTGSLSLAFAEAGFEVIGVDASPDMLAEAREKAAGCGLDLLLLNQDMTQLDLYGTIDAAVCTLDSINHLTREAQVRETFRRVSLFLRPGGIFLFDVNTLYKHREILGDQTFVYDLDDLYCVWQNAFDPETGIVEMLLDFFAREGETYVRSGDEVTERAYTDEQLTAWLIEAGLTVCARFSDLTQDAPGAEDERVVYVVKK